MPMHYVDRAICTKVERKKVAVYKTSSKGSEIIFCLLTKNGYSVQYIGKVDVVQGRLKHFDAAIFPGGYEHLVECLTTREFRDEIKNYVDGGGYYIGTCGGSLLAGWLKLGGVKVGYFRLFPYYIYYSLFGKRGEVEIEWAQNNKFGIYGTQNMTWVAGPYILEPGHLKIQAFYNKNKLFLPLKGKTAIAYGSHGNGRVLLFGPHPEYPCGGEDNSDLILKGVSWACTK